MLGALWDFAPRDGLSAAMVPAARLDKNVGEGGGGGHTLSILRTRVRGKPARRDGVTIGRRSRGPYLFGDSLKNILTVSRGRVKT